MLHDPNREHPKRDHTDLFLCNYLALKSKIRFAFVHNRVYLKKKIRLRPKKREKKNSGFSIEQNMMPSSEINKKSIKGEYVSMVHPSAHMIHEFKMTVFKRNWLQIYYSN